VAELVVAAAERLQVALLNSLSMKSTVLALIRLAYW